MIFKSFCLFVIAFVVPINAYPDIQISVEPGHKPTGQYKQVYYSNSEQTVILNLRGTDRCTDIDATLLQMTTKLAAEIDTQSVIDCNANHTEEIQPAPGQMKFNFTAPVVKRVTDFKWEFNSCSNNGCVQLGSFEFYSLPADYLQPLINWSEDNFLYVYDKSGVMQDFLDEKNITYFESVNLLPKDKQLISIIVIDDPDITLEDKVPELPNNKIIMIHEYPADLPIIYDKTTRAIPLLDVHMPLVGRLSRDAAAQKLFLEFFYMLPQSTIIEN